MKFFIKVLIFFSSTLLGAQTAEKLDSLILKGITARNNKDYSLSLELLTEVNAIAEDNHLYRHQFLAINNIGANYYSMLDYGEALDNYLEAYTIAIKHLDENEEMTVLNNIAILYSKEGDLEKAEEYFTKAYELAVANEESLKIGLYALNLGIVANKLNKLDVAVSYLKDSKKRLAEHPEISILADVAMADNKFKQGDFTGAKVLAESILPHLDDSALTEEKIETLILLSDISERNNKLVLAINYAKSALASAHNPEFKISAYNQLAKVYSSQGLVEDALISKDSIIAMTEALNQIKNGRLYESNKVKFEVANYKKELQQNKVLQAIERKRLYTLLGICALIIALISWALRNSFIKNKQRKILHHRSKEIIELELQKKESDNLVLEQQLQAQEVTLQLEQEKLKNEIDARNRKLATKALQISSRNELLKDIISSLSSQVEISKNAFLSKKVKELNHLLKSDSEWENFLKHFEEVNHNFIFQLKKRHPELTANDIRYISYLYMDLTNKEISSLFNITAVASRKRKERISLKMGLTESSELYSYLSSI
ncbi:tetratricopeptide repeat protein [Winogradskyella endarachnes]|uniref:Tetratricopeptide repeat protein n=1 Tax=Winogradskyella endarachnes TaxID=2681965 RepID=A0A6L6UC29_9FLAO|nr:tetratricopeptide repeat protein [Winogradskyella endarachnes]MUU78314.1 tetratricopeptide repeat protein [Winogradskyella endarachnes]